MFDLSHHLQDHHIELTPTMSDRLELFYQQLIEWNKVMNLTGIVEKEAVYEKHFYDSLSLAFAIPLSTHSICDVGAGAGFPSVPLSIVFPNTKITVVDSLAKRMKFIDTMKKMLPLNNVNLVVSRAENFLDGRDKFDIVTARAVATLPILLELLTPLAKINGYIVAYKGDHGDDEFITSKNAMKELGIVLHQRFEFDLPIEKSKRILFIFKKVSMTPMKYPRPFAKIQSSPL